MIGTGVGPSSGPARPRPVCHVGSSTGFAGTRLQPGQRADHLHRELRLARERLSGLKPRAEHTAGPAIGRAVKNLMTALSHRVGRDGLDEELLLEIAGILDEAAQKIERTK